MSSSREIARKKFLVAFLLASLATAPMARCTDLSAAIPRPSRQLVTVTTESWTATRATVQRYTRSDTTTPWTPIGRPMSALVGEHGLAWGRGLHAIPARATRLKREGDRCAPAGVFRITSAFGQLSAQEIGPLRIPYRHVVAGWEAVDDPASRYYNRIVDRMKIARPDWRSAERLWEGGHYRLALDLAHNPRPVPGAGSCIFLHEWIGHRRGTAGCTVLRREDLLELVRWLDGKANPVLLQVPRSEGDQVPPPARR